MGKKSQPTTAKKVAQAPSPKVGTDDDTKVTAVAVQAKEVTQGYRFVSFRNRPMVLVDDFFPHFIPLSKERFDKLAYPILGGQSRSRMQDIFSYMANTAEDVTQFDNLLAFGNPTIDESGEGHDVMIWDTKACSWVTQSANLYSNTVWRSPYSPLQADNYTYNADASTPKLQFILDLALQDEGVYDDIMQAMAPLIMDRKPDGVIWFVGDGANGKSTLMDALYRIFPGLLASITVKRLEDGRDTPSLNGVLGNVVKESSEGRVEDTETYKSVGTHEDFQVHKFHSQDSITINGNVHHIFSANNVPIFNDKGFSAKRRTFIIPFDARFESDPSFEDKTFTPEFFGALVKEMAKYASRLRKQGYKYQWSERTRNAKAEYDEDANNSQSFVTYMVEELGIVAFNSYNPVRLQYESWCMDNGQIPLGITNMRRAIKLAGFDRRSFRPENGVISKRYALQAASINKLEPAGLSYPGLFREPGWTETHPTTQSGMPIQASMDMGVGTGTGTDMDEGNSW